MPVDIQIQMNLRVSLWVRDRKTTGNKKTIMEDKAGYENFSTSFGDTTHLHG
jgi:hypothetical protein